ncbi:hypothetical protein [Pseudomonas sp. PDM11]|uniref:hypothetical protein n=1 Tax=Pseudomonas sp. PDM11 TaxID=2769309 RepID=UPI00177C7050|nr:hypothetical protein [Pseudomonas sp. PDM11]MBD9397137.1 hypothetical protein [Pseudomonas sp. PDM11]
MFFIDMRKVTVWGGNSWSGFGANSTGKPVEYRSEKRGQSDIILKRADRRKNDAFEPSRKKPYTPLYTEAFSTAVQLSGRSEMFTR